MLVPPVPGHPLATQATYSDEMLPGMVQEGGAHALVKACTKQKLNFRKKNAFFCHLFFFFKWSSIRNNQRSSQHTYQVHAVFYKETNLYLNIVHCTTSYIVVHCIYIATSQVGLCHSPGISLKELGIIKIPVLYKILFLKKVKHFKNFAVVYVSPGNIQCHLFHNTLPNSLKWSEFILNIWLPFPWINLSELVRYLANVSQTEPGMFVHPQFQFLFLMNGVYSLLLLMILDL